MTRHVIKKPAMEFNTTKRRVRKRILWLREDVDKLFDIWGEHLTELSKSRRNSHVYQKMSEEMKRAGVNVSWEELRVKMNNVTQIWRREKRLVIFSGQPSEWDFFEAADKLLASRKSLEITSTYYVDDSSSHGDMEEMQSISSDFEMTKQDGIKKYNRKVSHSDPNDDIEKMLRQIESSSRSQPEMVTVKSEIDVDVPSNASTPLPTVQNQQLTSNKDKDPLQLPKSKQSKPSVSSQNVEIINKESLNTPNRDDDDDDDNEPRRPKLFRLKKSDSKRTSDGVRKNNLSKEAIFNLKQEKLSLEIEHLKKLNCKVDLQIERAQLENRLLNLKVKRYQRSYTHFSL